ncbi:MAG: DsbA family oxidoreductase [Rhizobiales bacterium]|nr:DsbA family oxidoreductase [Hyphomicrobiales bacterium]
MDIQIDDQRIVTVEMIADLACPWCYLGLVRLNKARAMRPALHVELRWWPYLLNPQLPRDGMDRRTYLRAKFGGDGNAKEVYARIEQAGREEGLPFALDRIQRTPNTVFAQRLVLLAQEEAKGEALITTLFKAMFERGQDIGNVDVLMDIAEGEGVSRDDVATLFSGDRFAADIIRGYQRAHMMGVQGVPVYVVEREHVIAGAQAPEVLAGLLDVAAAKLPA